MTNVEVLAIGDELLRGIVHESNAHWIAKRVAARGAVLGRVTLLPDDPTQVIEEIRAGLARAPDLYVTHGGLGPTDDDRTRSMIAEATGRPLARDPDAEAIVRARYAALAATGAVDAEPNDARLGMADLPRGARPLDNHVGTAPGFLIELGPTTLVALPGVPPEMAWIWENSLAPTLDAVIGPGGFAEVTHTLELRDESVIADMLLGVATRHDGVYVKSRASGYGETDRIRVTLHAVGTDRDAAERLVQAADADLKAGLAERGIALRADQ